MYFPLFGHLNLALLQNKWSWARETAQCSTGCLHKESLAADKNRFQTLAVLETFHTHLMAQGAMISIIAIINSSAITGLELRAHLLTAGCRKHVEYSKTPWKKDHGGKFGHLRSLSQSLSDISECRDESL